MIKPLMGLMLLLLLSACISGGNIKSINQEQDLSVLPAAYIPPHKAVSASSLNTVVESYRAALSLINDNAEREHIARRLAVLELRFAENTQIENAKASPKALYADVINTYNDLLMSQKGKTNTDQLLYPLAKSYELSGDIDSALKSFNQLVIAYPRSVYFSEAQFRRAEILFSKQQYGKASKAYAAVVTRNEETPFLLNAKYMMGWSEFKLGHYSRALIIFSQVVDEKIDNISGDKNVNNLLDDVFRVMALSFSYTEGDEAVAQLINKVGEKEYVDRLYENLGDLYLRKKRYRDSAAAFARYVSQYPNSELSAQFKQMQIDAFVTGQFPDDVREQKRQFSNSYAVLGEYWLATTNESRDFIKEKLSVYLDELASYHHAMAQKKSLPNMQKRSYNLTKTQHYKQAAKWYEEWIRSFPNAVDLAGKWFLLAETRFKIGLYKGAIAAYENAAYINAGLTQAIDIQNKDSRQQVNLPVNSFTQHNDAGYAAWMSYDYVLKGLQQQQDSENLAIWQQQKIDSALTFIQTFPNDKRKHSMLAQSIRELLALNQYRRTIELSDQLIAENNVSDTLQLTAWLSSAHAFVAVDEYAAAEKRYAHALTLLSLEGNQQLQNKYYQVTLDNYAASIYRQGEQLSSNGDIQLAANTFLRVSQLAAGSAIEATATHDASVLLIQAEQWAAAIDVLQSFQHRFPLHPQVKNIPSRLLQAKQAVGDFNGAALQAVIISNNDSDPNVRREALYTAAELFDKAGDVNSAIKHFRQYAHQYLQPMASQMEAMMHLSQLYKANKSINKRQFWLKKMIARHKSATVKTDRSRFLAAFSAAEIAEIYLPRYYAIKLTHPLKASLAKKQKALTTAINYYKRAASFQLAKFSTLATQRMGEVYANFATALMSSEKPSSLSALELEQYNFLLEEQAYPFEEQAIEFFKVNIEQSWQGIHTKAVKNSYEALSKLLPARFNKSEIRPARPK